MDQAQLNTLTHFLGNIADNVLRDNEDNNEEAGEHWTPRDAVRLMANLMFLPVAEQIESGTYRGGKKPATDRPRAWQVGGDD